MKLLLYILTSLMTVIFSLNTQPQPDSFNQTISLNDNTEIFFIQSKDKSEFLEISVKAKDTDIQFIWLSCENGKFDSNSLGTNDEKNIYFDYIDCIANYNLSDNENDLLVIELLDSNLKTKYQITFDLQVSESITIKKSEELYFPFTYQCSCYQQRDSIEYQTGEYVTRAIKCNLALI